MTKYEDLLLERAYKNRLETMDNEYSFLLSSGIVTLHGLNAALSLEEQGYIKVLSDNINISL